MNSYDINSVYFGSTTAIASLPTYQISGAGLSTGMVDVPCPRVLPEAGDILVFTKRVVTPGSQHYEVDDEVHLVKRTQDAPYGKLSSLGNWQAISKHGVSIWSNIEWMMAEGNLVHYDYEKDE